MPKLKDKLSGEFLLGESLCNISLFLVFILEQTWYNDIWNLKKDYYRWFLKDNSIKII